jgi:hypothetical protein
MSSITIEQYSEKAIVVRGNTIPYKDKLLSIGGKWNKMLKGGEGWIFPLTKKPIVEKTLSEPPSTVPIDNEDNSVNENKESSYKKYTKNSSSNSVSSSEVVLTKKEYLHLISRIERLEQMILNKNNEQEIETNVIEKRKKSKTSSLPLLSSIDEDNLPEPEEDDEEEREQVQPLLRKKNKKN